MKKVLLIMFLLTIAVSAKTFTRAEKQEMIRQFAEFQNIVKNKDEDGFISMLESPQIDGFFSIIGPFTDEDEKEIQRDYNGIILTERIIRRHSAEIFQEMEETLTYVKVNPDTGVVKNYFEDQATEEDKKRRYFLDKSKDSYFYYNSQKEKVYLENLRIWDKRIDLRITELGLFVVNYLSPNKLTPRESFMGNGFIYEFSFENNKLKLHDIYMND